MTSSPWLDLVLVLLLAAVAVVFWALRTSDAYAPGVGSGASLVGRLRYYPRLARQAGFDPDALRWLYWLAKIGLALLLPLAWMELAVRLAWRSPFALLMLLALAGFAAPDLWLLTQRRVRQRRIRNTLSFFLDLIVALVRSGLGLEDAFRRAGGEGLEPGHPLADEAAIVERELEAGQERGFAFQAMAERTGVAELRGVATALRMGSRMGSAVETTLAAQADLMRVKRREQALREISLAALKTLVPVMLCGFPVFLVLAMFPVTAEIIAIFTELARLF